MPCNWAACPLVRMQSALACEVEDVNAYHTKRDALRMLAEMQPAACQI